MKVKYGARAQLRKLKPGVEVRITWIDSGRDAHDLRTQLAHNITYGVVWRIIEETQTVIVGMEIMRGEENDEGGSNRWGYIWMPSIEEVKVFQ